jgi:uridine kinase
MLKSGNKIDMPVYDYKTHTRTGELFTIYPKKIIIVDGILIFTKSEILNLLDFKIFIDTPSDIRLIRRITRDIIERGRTLESVVRQYLYTVRPMFYEFVAPSKKNADIILSGEFYNPKKIEDLIHKFA